MMLKVIPIRLDPCGRNKCEQAVNFTHRCKAPADYLVDYQKPGQNAYESALCREHARKIIEAALALMAQSYLRNEEVS